MISESTIDERQPLRRRPNGSNLPIACSPARRSRPTKPWPCWNAPTTSCSTCWPPRTASAAAGSATRCSLYFLMNAKSGLCPEDCGYCSQSKVSEAEIPRYNLLSRDKLLDGARAGRRAASQARTASSSPPAARTSARCAPSTTIVPEIKQQYNLKICACLGLLTPEQAQRAEGLRRRSREPQPQHERSVLRRDLHDAHLPRTASPRCAPCATPAWSCAPAASSAWASSARDVVRDGVRAARPGRASRSRSTS